MQQKVRPFTAADLDTVSGIFADVQDGWGKKALAESLENSSIKSYVLEKDGGITAFAAYLAADDAELVFVVTDKKYLRQGCGEKILTETLAELGLPCVLEVRESNTAAIRLYEKLGFKLLGRRNNFYSNPAEAALIYKKEI